MQRIIEPEPGRILVKLGVSEYGNIPVPPKDFDSLTWGTIIKVNDSDQAEYGNLIGRTGHWRKYKDDMRVDDLPGQETYALVDIVDLMGTSYEE